MRILLNCGLLATAMVLAGCGADTSQPGEAVATTQEQFDEYNAMMMEEEQASADDAEEEEF